MNAETAELLRLTGVTKRYEAVEGAQGPLVLNNVNLNVAAGQSLAIVGPSGSGKSTLLNIIGTLDRPTAGEVWLEGQDVCKLGESTLARIRRARIGFVFQMHHLLPQCSVLENVLIPTLAGLVDQSKSETQSRAVELLERVGLRERLAHRPGQLSGGERQRVTLVRALINKPRLLLADEPTGSLDRKNAAMLMELIVKLNKQEGVTLITVTHDQHQASLMDRVFELVEATLTEISPQRGT